MRPDPGALVYQTPLGEGGGEGGTEDGLSSAPLSESACIKRHGDE